MYLLSSNIDNASFYNLHGFYSVAEITLGIDNSTWNGKPVVCSLVSRNQLCCTQEAEMLNGLYS